MLRIENLTIRYDACEVAVQHFNLHMKAGEVTAIVGESGSGKSSVLRAVMGALPKPGSKAAGQILFHGQPLIGKPEGEFRKLRGKRISMIFQDSAGTLNPVRTIGSQFTEYIRAHEKMPKKQAREKAVYMLERMRLADPARLMRCCPHELSGGMCQRVGIAMAMAFEPELLLADEPTSALDVTTQAQIVREMLALRREFGTAILIVTHNLGVASYMADRMLVMHQGKTTDCGTREDVIFRPRSEYTKKLLAAVPEMDVRYIG